MIGFPAIVTAIAISAGAGPVPTAYEFPLAPSAKGPDGGPLYVSDAEIAATIPGFDTVGARTGTCMSGETIPRMLDITYAPSLTGPHSARTNSLTCEQPAGEQRLTCQPHLSGVAVVFDVDPRQYFALGPNTRLVDALDVFRAFRDGAIHFAEGKGPWIKDLPVREISVEGSHSTIRRSDCGCSETLEVERRDVGGTPTFFGSLREGICT